MLFDYYIQDCERLLYSKCEKLVSKSYLKFDFFIVFGILYYMKFKVLRKKMLNHIYLALETKKLRLFVHLFCVICRELGDCICFIRDIFSELEVANIMRTFKLLNCERMGVTDLQIIFICNILNAYTSGQVNKSFAAL